MPARYNTFVRTGRVRRACPISFMISPKISNAAHLAGAWRWPPELGSFRTFSPSPLAAALQAGAVPSFRQTGGPPHTPLSRSRLLCKSKLGSFRILSSPLPPVIYSGNWVRLVKFLPTVQRFPNTPGHLEDGFVSHLLPSPCPQPNAPKIGFVPSNHYGLLRPFLGIGFVPSTSHGPAPAPSGIGFVPQTFRTPAANPNPLPSC